MLDQMIPNESNIFFSFLRFEKRPVEKSKIDGVQKPTDDFLEQFIITIIILLVVLVFVLSCGIYKRKVVFAFLRNRKKSKSK